MDSLLSLSNLALWLVTLGNTVLIFALIRKISKGIEPKEQKLTMLEENQEIEDISLINEANEKFQIAKFPTPTLFVFISPTCEPCKNQLPQIEAVFNSRAREGLDTYIVCLSDTQTTNKFVADNQISSPVYLPSPDANSFVEKYKTFHTPSYYLIDEHSKVAKRGIVGDFDNGWLSIVREETSA